MISYSYILYNHDQERKFDSKSFVGISWAGDVVGRDIGTHDFQHGTLDVWVSDSLNVSVSHALIPYLQRLRSKFKV